MGWAWQEDSLESGVRSQESGVTRLESRDRELETEVICLTSTIELGLNLPTPDS